MIYKYLPLLLLAAFSSFISIPHKEVEVVSTSTDPKTLAENAKANWVVKSQLVYSKIDTGYFSLPNFEAFSKAFEGFEQLKNQGVITNNILTIIDFSLPSTQDRLWVIDMDENKIIFHTLVAHGKNSGEDYASSFSNTIDSNKSSLGFFTTGETYIGQHGLSLKLDGLEKGINDKARQRAIVVHGADYVSKNFIAEHNRLGRSQGCPALPVGLSKKIIQTIKNKSCLFIYYPSNDYERNSKLIS